MQEKTLTEVLKELGMIPTLPDVHTLDGDGTNRYVLDGKPKDKKPQNEEKSRE